MQATFYKNTSDNRVVNKSLTTLKSDTIIQNQPIDRDKPIFNIVYDENLLTSNYCYIDSFERYYYIESVNTQSQMLQIVCSESDVLMSFSRYLNQLNATIERQSNKFNTYLADEQVDVYSNSMYQIVNFPNSARVNETFILLVNGG